MQYRIIREIVHFPYIYNLFYAPRAPITFWQGRHLLVYGFSHTHCLFPCSTNYAITLLSPKAEFGSRCCKQVGNVLSHDPNCFFIFGHIFCDHVAFLFHATNIFDFSRHVFGTIATLLLFIPPFLWRPSIHTNSVRRSIRSFLATFVLFSEADTHIRPPCLPSSGSWLEFPPSSSPPLGIPAAKWNVNGKKRTKILHLIQIYTFLFVFCHFYNFIVRINCIFCDACGE